MLNRHSQISLSLRPVSHPATVTGIKSARRTGTTKGITEIVLAHNQSLSFVLPSLAFFSSQNSDRWLTWLLPKGVCSSIFKHYDFDFSRTRFVYPKDNEHAFWLFWEALAEGNSYMVVGAPGLLTEQQIERLEYAAEVGDCSGLLLRDRASAIN